MKQNDSVEPKIKYPDVMTVDVKRLLAKHEKVLIDSLFDRFFIAGEVYTWSHSESTPISEYYRLTSDDDPRRSVEFRLTELAGMKDDAVWERVDAAYKEYSKLRKLEESLRDVGEE